MTAFWFPCLTLTLASFATPIDFQIADCVGETPVRTAIHKGDDYLISFENVNLAEVRAVVARVLERHPEVSCRRVLVKLAGGRLMTELSFTTPNGKPQPKSWQPLVLFEQLDQSVTQARELGLERAQMTASAKGTRISFELASESYQDGIRQAKQLVSESFPWQAKTQYQKGIMTITAETSSK